MGSPERWSKNLIFVVLNMGRTVRYQLIRVTENKLHWKTVPIFQNRWIKQSQTKLDVWDMKHPMIPQTHTCLKFCKLDGDKKIEKAVKPSANSLFMFISLRKLGNMLHRFSIEPRRIKSPRVYVEGDMYEWIAWHVSKAENMVVTRVPLLDVTQDRILTLALDCG